MTAQEIIKKFMSALNTQNYTTGTSALDDAVRASSRFNGIQEALDQFYSDQKLVERAAIKVILGNNYKEEYDGLQLSDLLERAETDTALAKVLNTKATYSRTPRNYSNLTFTATERIRILTADTFLVNFCGIVLEHYIFPYKDTNTGIYAATYNKNYTTGNVDTGAITGADAGGDTVKNASSVVPEIGNKYTAETVAPQIINTGSNDWIVKASDEADTITSGGADSIDAAGGADIIFVGGESATISAGAADNAADSVTIASNVKVFNVADFDEFDTLKIEGDFVLGRASLDSDTETVTVIDSTGSRVFTVKDWTSAQNAAVNVNGETLKFGEWLSNFISYEETESTNTAVTSTAVESAVIVNLDDVTGVGGTFSLPSATSTEATYNANSTRGTVGTISFEFPNTTTFTARGLTVELWGENSNSAPTDSTIKTLTLDKMSDAQKNIFAGLYKWWIKEGLKLNEESLGLGFNTEGVNGANIKVFFYSDSEDSSLALVRNHGSGFNLELGINMAHYSDIKETDTDGSGSTSLLDRTIAHELTHAVMAANVLNFNRLPQFITEGLAELIHGIDDERPTRIWDLAGGATDTSRITSALDLNNTGTGEGDAYAGGYLFLRYYAKQAAEQLEENIALGDATVKVELNGEDATYYAYLNNNLSVENAITTADADNYSVGTAANKTYKVTAGITQQIYSNNDNWKFSEIGSRNTLIAGGGADSVSISGESNSVSLGAGDNLVSINGGVRNSIFAGNGNDIVDLRNGGYNLIDLKNGNNVVSIYDSKYNSITTGVGVDSIKVDGAGNVILTGAGNDIISVTNYTNNATINAANYIDAGDGNDSVSAASQYQTILGGAGNDTIWANGSNQVISGGTDQDLFIVRRGADNLTLTDFSIAENDELYLFYSVDSATYETKTDKITLGTTNIYLDNVDDISNFFGMTIYLNSYNKKTNLQNLLDAVTFDWSDGTYYFLVEDNLVSLHKGALAYKGNKLQSGKSYAKVTVKDNQITFDADSNLRLEIEPPTTNNYSLTVNKSAKYVFNGAATLFNTPADSVTSIAYTGDYIVSSSLYFYDEAADKNKLITFSGTTGTAYVNVSIGDSLEISRLTENNKVSISDGIYTELYTANRLSIIKEAINATFDESGTNIISEDIHTYSTAYAIKDVITLKYTEVNHYVNDYANSKVNLISGTLTLEGHTYKIVDGNSITLVYDSTGKNIEGIENFDEGESVIIDGETYTVIEGKIIRASDGEYYNSDVAKFIKNFVKEMCWGAFTGWKIDGNNANYFVKGEINVAINNLNLDGVEAVDGEIDGLTVESNTVVVAEKLIGEDEITFENNQYVLVFAKENHVSIFGGTDDDSISVDGSSTKVYEVVSLIGGAGNDSVSVKNIALRGVMNLEGEEVAVDNIQVSNFYVEGATLGSSVDITGGNIAVTNVTIDGANNNFAVNAKGFWENTIKVNNIHGKGNFDIVSGSSSLISISSAFGSNFTITGAEDSPIYVTDVESDNFEVSGTVRFTKVSGNFKISEGSYLSIEEGELSNFYFGDSKTGNINTYAELINCYRDATSEGKFALGEGNDILYIASKEIEVDAGEGDNYIETRADVNTIFTRDSSNYVGAKNTITSGSGNDTVVVASAQDLINTGAGNDLISGTFTNNTITSGAGNDTLAFDSAPSKVTVTDFSADDAISLSTEIKNGTFENGVLTLGQNVITLQGINGDDILHYLSVKVKNGGKNTTLGDLLGLITWEFEGDTARYGDIITVTGLSSKATLEDLTVDGDKVIVSANALDANKTVTISDGYYLELASDVTTPVVTDSYWGISKSTADYIGEGYTAGYVVSDNTIFYQNDIEGDTLTTLTGLNLNVTTGDLSVSDTTVTVAANALTETNTVKITNDYNLDLASDVTTPVETATKWKVASGTANYLDNGLSSGYVVTDSDTIVYRLETEGDTLITVKGLSSAATARDFSLSDTTVTLSANALSNTTVTISDGYTLALGNNVTTPQTTSKTWSVSKGTANYLDNGLSAGYVVTDSNTIVYQKTTEGNTLVTVKGLSTDATTKDISISKTNVTLSANALNNKKTVTITDGYNLKLSSNVEKPKTTSKTWSVSKGTAKYLDNGLSAGYVVTDSNTVVYQKETLGNALITITGLSTSANVSDISLSGTTVTIAAHALATKGTVKINDGYTLALGKDVVTPQATALTGSWSVTKGTAKYISAGTTAGHVLSNNTIIYKTVTKGDTLVTVTGLNTSATEADLHLKNKIVTVSANALAEKNTVKASDGYTLALAKDVTTPKPAAATGSWSVTNGTAKYTGAGTTAGYILSNNQIVYQAAKDGSTLITVTGLKNTATESDIVLRNTTVTVYTNALSESNTVKINDGYTLALARNVTTPKATASSGHWSILNGTANYIDAGKTAGYVVNDNTIVYQAAKNGDTLFTITGLNPSTTARQLSLNKKVITVSAAALAQQTVSISGEGYTLALGKGIEGTKDVPEGWSISNGVADYQTAYTTAGYSLVDNQIIYTEEIAPETLVTVRGLKKTASVKNLTLKGNSVTVAAAAVTTNGEVSISEGYALTLGKGTYSKVSVIGSEDVDTITANAGNLFISTGGDNDLITLGANTSKNTIIAGAGDDSITVSKGKNIYQYAEGDGDDVITGFTSNDSLKITSGEIDSWNIYDSDLVLKIGSGSITIKDGAGKSINIIDSNSTKATTFIYDEGIYYNAKKTAVTLSADYVGSYSAYPSSVVTVNGAETDAIAINGNNKANVIIGGNGADTLNGDTGNDSLTGGAGADVFIFEKNKGNDVIKDYAEEDIISLGSDISGVSVKSSRTVSDVILKVGSNSLTIKDGIGKKITTADSLGNNSTHIYESGKIYDAEKENVTLTSTFKGTLEDEVITANGTALTAASSVVGNDNDNIILLGRGADTLNGGAGNDTLTGGKGNDVFIFDGGDDVITDYEVGEKISLKSAITNSTVEGNDVILTTADGTLTVKDGAGKKIKTVADRITATKIYTEGLTYNEKQTAVTLDPGYSINYTASISAVVTVDGSAADYIAITGNQKNNLLIGSEGNNTLHGAKGNDTLTGGDGADIFIYGRSEGKDVITDYAEEDKISIGAAITAVSVGSTKNSPDVVLKFNSDSLTIKKGSGKKITITDSLGADSTYIYEVGKIYNEDKTSVTLTSAFKGTLDGGIISADGSDITKTMKIIANENDNVIIGGKGADSLSGLAGDDTLIGGDANDSILGGAGNDSLNGGNGNDTLNGGAGNDTLTGGAGNNLFVYEGGNDVITDYTTGSDKIKISTAINGWTINDRDVIFETDDGNITVINGKGKNITMIDSKNKNTTQKYSKSSTNARTLELLYDNNFMTDDAQISAITEVTADNYSAGKIETVDYSALAQESTILTFKKEK